MLGVQTLAVAWDNSRLHADWFYGQFNLCGRIFRGICWRLATDILPAAFDQSIQLCFSHHNLENDLNKISMLSWLQPIGWSWTCMVGQIWACLSECRARKKHAQQTNTECTEKHRMHNIKHNWGVLRRSERCYGGPGNPGSLALSLKLSPVEG